MKIITAENDGTSSAQIDRIASLLDKSTAISNLRTGDCIARVDLSNSVGMWSVDLIIADISPEEAAKSNVALLNAKTQLRLSIGNWRQSRNDTITEASITVGGHTRLKAAGIRPPMQKKGTPEDLAAYVKKWLWENWGVFHTSRVGAAGKEAQTEPDHDEMAVLILEKIGGARGAAVLERRDIFPAINSKWSNSIWLEMYRSVIAALIRSKAINDVPTMSGADRKFNGSSELSTELSKYRGLVAASKSGPAKPDVPTQTIKIVTPPTQDFDDDVTKPPKDAELRAYVIDLFTTPQTVDLEPRPNGFTAPELHALCSSDYSAMSKEQFDRVLHKMLEESSLIRTANGKFKLPAIKIVTPESTKPATDSHPDAFVQSVILQIMGTEYHLKSAPTDAVKKSLAEKGVTATDGQFLRVTQGLVESGKLTLTNGEFRSPGVPSKPKAEETVHLVAEVRYATKVPPRMEPMWGYRLVSEFEMPIGESTLDDLTDNLSADTLQYLLTASHREAVIQNRKGKHTDKEVHLVYVMLKQWLPDRKTRVLVEWTHWAPWWSESKDVARAAGDTIQKNDGSSLECRIRDALKAGGAKFPAKMQPDRSMLMKPDDLDQKDVVAMLPKAKVEFSIA